MSFIEPFLTANGLAALSTLSILEIVLGIDNLVFISVLTARLDAARARTARAIGLSLAFVFRIALLASLSWIMGLTRPVLAVSDTELSWRDIILVVGGLFLIWKATHEIHGEVEADEDRGKPSSAPNALMLVIGQLVVIDLVFSLDSIITAIGLADDLEIMIVAVCIAMIVMFLAARPVGDFIAKHPTTKMLALTFLLLIGMALLADGFHVHIPRGYIYFSMGFAGMVEVFNVLARRNRGKRKR
jgi:predicted tellurium resistance membrane protein TerC